jgi:hypothetical protein
MRKMPLVMHNRQITHKLCCNRKKDYLDSPVRPSGLGTPLQQPNSLGFFSKIKNFSPKIKELAHYSQIDVSGCFCGMIESDHPLLKAFHDVSKSSSSILRIFYFFISSLS